MQRNILENQSRLGAGVISEQDEYQLVRVLDNFEMFVLKTDESVTPCLVRDGFWESWITTWFINNIDSATVFFDIGANTGYYSFLASRLGAQAVAFEPNPVYADMIRASAEHLGLGHSFRIHEVALSNKAGELTLHIPDGFHGSASLNTLPSGYPFKDISVKVDRFDNIYQVCGAGKQVLKIDAESEEERILEGAENFLSQTTHREVILEYTPGAYSEHFISDLLSSWNVGWINFSGETEPIDGPEWFVQHTDWVMLVLN